MIKPPFPAGNGPQGGISPTTESLTYLIRFQNTGTDTAFTVVVRDTLASVFDPAKLSVISSSHPFTPEIKNGRQLAFHFNNILLPDSNRNEPGSHGFVKLRVGLVAGLPLGTVIKNKASIYFDYNEPVLTNETRNTLEIVTSVVAPRIEAAGNIVVYPNPSRDVLVIKPAETRGRPWDISITDATGRVLFNKRQINQANYTLPIDSYPAGIYFIKVSVNGKVQSGRFLRE